MSEHEHRPVFPSTILLGLQYLTSFNTFYEMLVGWIFLNLTLFVLWRLLCQTFQDGKWVIIPIAWMTYSFTQYEILLDGVGSIMFYLTLLMFVSTIYFLNKIKYSPISIVPAIICSFVASFSEINGLSIWIVGFLVFTNFSRLKLLIPYAISGITAFVLFFNGWTYQQHTSQGLTQILVNHPFGFLSFFLAYLGNSIRLRGAENVGIDAFSFSISLGIIVVGIFIVAILLYRHFRIGQNSNQTVTPWLQISIFALLTDFITAIGRIPSYGIEYALSSRYVAFSNLFLDGTLVISLMVLFYIKKNTSTTIRRKFLKGSFIVLMVLVGSDIGLGNVVGWLGGSMFYERHIVGTSCLMNFESASDDCLQNLYWDASTIRERAKFLQEQCLGPFASTCK
ncbi:MAG: hypothetical protein KGH88_07585 [Thaumarchaeota archaeon]|nr:hypothetical protein [Nitrososphaerota archaeon]